MKTLGRNFHSEEWRSVALTLSLILRFIVFSDRENCQSKHLNLLVSNRTWKMVSVVDHCYQTSCLKDTKGKIFTNFWAIWLRSKSKYFFFVLQSRDFIKYFNAVNSLINKHSKRRTPYKFARTFAISGDGFPHSRWSTLIKVWNTAL